MDGELLYKAGYTVMDWNLELGNVFQLVDHDFNSCTFLQHLGTEMLQLFRVRLGFDAEFRHRV